MDHAIPTDPTSHDLHLKFHEEYRSATGLDLPFRIGMDYAYGLFAREFHLGAITMVVRHLRHIYKDQPSILRSSLRWGYLINDRDRFAELLAEATATRRNAIRPATNRQQVLAATGRSETKPVATAERADNVLERTRLASMLEEWRRNNP